MAMPARSAETHGTQAPHLTVLDLVAAVQEFAESDAEVTATLRYMAQTGQLKLEVGSAPWAA